MDSIKVRLQMASGTSSSAAFSMTGLMRGIAAPFAMAAFVNAQIFTTFGEASRFWDKYLQAGDDRSAGEISCQKDLFVAL